MLWNGDERRTCKRYGIKRLGIITPYMPVGDRQVRRFFTDCGFEVVNLKGLKCQSPVLIAHESQRTLRDAIIEVNQGKVDAIVQVGTNLAMAEVAGMAEFWLDKPVIAINTASAGAGWLGRVSLDLPLTARVTVAALAGMMIGTHLAPRISARTLTRAFAILLMLLAIAMFAGELRR